MECKESHAAADTSCVLLDGKQWNFHFSRLFPGLLLRVPRASVHSSQIVNRKTKIENYQWVILRDAAITAVEIACFWDKCGG